MNTTTRTSAQELTELMPGSSSRRIASLAHTFASKAARMRRLAVAVALSFSFVVFGASSAEALQRFDINGQTGSTYEPYYFVGCATTSSTSSRVSVRGVTVTAAPAVQIQQRVGVTVTVLWSSSPTGSNPVPVGQQTGYQWVFVGATSVSQFPTWYWNFNGHGYFSVTIHVYWYDMWGQTLGRQVWLTNAWSDFNATYRYNYGTCYA